MSKKINFTYKGLCVPVLAAFNDDLSMNIEIIPKYAQFLAKNGIDGVLVNGTTGEGMTLSIPERKLVAEAWVGAAKTTKQHIMIQVGGCPLPDVIILAEHAEKVGVDSILCLPELYYRPSKPADLINYLKLVGAAAPNTPLLYYHNPLMSNVTLNMAKFLHELHEQIPSFAGMKFTSGDLDAATAAFEASRKKYTVFMGTNTILPGAFTMGIDSAMPSSMNFFPEYAKRIRQAVKEGKGEEAREIQKKLTEVWDILSKDGARISALKAVMNLLTPINVGRVRPPISSLTAEQSENVKKSIQKLMIK